MPIPLSVNTMRPLALRADLDQQVAGCGGRGCGASERSAFFVRLSITCENICAGAEELEVAVHAHHDRLAFARAAVRVVAMAACTSARRRSAPVGRQPHQRALVICMSIWWFMLRTRLFSRCPAAAAARRSRLRCGRLVADRLGDQLHRGQRRAQLVRHDAHGPQRVIELLAPQVGRGQAQHDAGVTSRSPARRRWWRPAPRTWRRRRPKAWNASQPPAGRWRRPPWPGASRSGGSRSGAWPQCWRATPGCRRCRNTSTKKNQGSVIQKTEESDRRHARRAAWRDARDRPAAASPARHQQRSRRSRRAAAARCPRAAEQRMPSIVDSRWHGSASARDAAPAPSAAAPPRPTPSAAAMRSSSRASRAAGGVGDAVQVLTHACGSVE
jgi:hypothetical protein